MVERLPLDPLIRICSYLCAAELGKLLLSNKFLNTHPDQLRLWRSVYTTITPEILQKLWFNIKIATNIDQNDVSLSESKELARQVSCLKSGNFTQWFRTRYHSLNSGGQLDAMEAHTVSILCDRYAVVIAGWGQGDPSIVYLIDGLGLPRALILVPVRETRNPPRFRYGFSTLTYQNELYVFGGCQNGGYSGDCNDFYKLSLSFVRSDDAPSGEVQLDTAEHVQQMQLAGIQEYEALATYSLNLTPAPVPHVYSPITRAYHTAVVMRYEGEQGMMLWGGLHERQGTTALEFFSFASRSWQALQAEGTEPSPRFGHSCVAIGEGRFIFTGGSDGNDLLRNGRELRDIFVLSVVKGAGGGGDRLVWSTLSVQNFASRHHLVPGRCHLACLVGENKVLYFAGGARNSARLVMLDLPSEGGERGEGGEGTVGEAQIRCPMIYDQAEPVKRVSTAGGLVGGRYLMVFGGWNNHYRELGDVWCLDLCPGLEACPSAVTQLYPSLAVTEAFLQQPPLRQADEEGEEEEEEGEYEGEEGMGATGGQGLNNNALLLQLLQQGNIGAMGGLGGIIQMLQQAGGQWDEEDEEWDEEWEAGQGEDSEDEEEGDGDEEEYDEEEDEEEEVEESEENEEGDEEES